jgi:hypothetical protein
MMQRCCELLCSSVIPLQLTAYHILTRWAFVLDFSRWFTYFCQTQLLLVKILSYLTNIICSQFLPHVVIVRHILVQCIKHQSHVQIVKLCYCTLKWCDDVSRYIFLFNSHTQFYCFFVVFLVLCSWLLHLDITTNHTKSRDSQVMHTQSGTARVHIHTKVNAVQK